MSKRVWPAAAIGAAAMATACSHPFSTRLEEYGPRIPVERTRSIEGLNLDRHEAPSQPEPPEDQVRQPPPQPFEDMEKVRVSVEQARAWTLENNLDTRVSLIDPVIANQAITEEEAAFEATFFSDVQFAKTDQPTATQLVGSQADQIDFAGGVRIPLRTGGEATVQLPINRTETNNPFSTLNPSVTTDLEISYSQPLLRNAGRWANTHRIRVAALQQGVEEARTKLEVIRQIAAADRAYWRLNAAQRELEVRQQQYELAREQLERAKRRVRAGDAAEIEITRAEEGVAERLEAIIVAQNDVRLRQRELKQIINVPGLELGSDAAITPTTEPDPVRYELEEDALVQTALDKRMELLELELQLTIDQSTIAFNRNQALPLFTVDYTYRINGLGGDLNESLDQLQEDDFNDQILGVSAEIPIGNRAAKSVVQQAILERLQRLATRELRRQEITQEVLDAIDSIRSGWQRVLAARQSSLLAARTVAAEERQFEVGMNTSTDVLDAQTRLAEAQLAEIDAVTEYQIAQVDLAFATGTLLGAARIQWRPLDPRGAGDANEPAFSGPKISAEQNDKSADLSVSGAR